MKPSSAVPVAGGAFTLKWAKFWRVTRRTIQRWSKRPEMPRIDDVTNMIRWAAGPERKPAAFLTRVAELRTGKNTREATDTTTEKNPKATEPKETFTDPDWLEFEAANSPIADPQAQMQTLEKLRNYYAFKLRKANSFNDETGIRNFSDLVIKYEKAIRDNKLAADKLGIEAGDLLPRADHEAIISAQAFWTMRAIDAALDRVTPRLLNLSFPEEARLVLEPALLATRFFEPLVNSARSAARNGLPEWFIARYIESIDDYLENGRALVLAQLHPPEQILIDGEGI